MSSNQAGNPALGRRVYAGRKVVREGSIDVDASSGEVLGGRLQPVYVYEAPVRIWHWVMMLAMIVLAATGYLIGSPWSGPRGEAAFSYFSATRMIHFPRPGSSDRVRCASTGHHGNHHARDLRSAALERKLVERPVPRRATTFHAQGSCHGPAQPAGAVRDVRDVRAGLDRDHPDRLALYAEQMRGVRSG
jgi:hypothetical protein